jgi:hypothetical protein
MSIENNDRHANVGASLAEKFMRDDDGDAENSVRDAIAALLHYAAKVGMDPLKEAEWGVWYWFNEHNCGFRAKPPTVLE